MRFLNVLGKLLISVGVGVLLFVAWTLWGTGIYTRQQQERLAQEFAQQPAVNVRGSERAGPPKGYAPAPGAPVFKLKIPAIDVSKIVVEGVEAEQLALGPGHYPSCRKGFDPPLCTELPEVWPGEQGRVIVSGHRTTYDHPFFDLDKLEKGDEIITVTKWGKFTYSVTGLRIVSPNSTDIANPAATNGYEIVLTTCNPKYSAAQRLVAFGELEKT